MAEGHSISIIRSWSFSPTTVTGIFPSYGAEVKFEGIGWTILADMKSGTMVSNFIVPEENQEGQPCRGVIGVGQFHRVFAAENASKIVILAKKDGEMREYIMILDAPGYSEFNDMIAVFINMKFLHPQRTMTITYIHTDPIDVSVIASP